MGGWGEDGRMLSSLETWGAMWRGLVEEEETAGPGTLGRGGRGLRSFQTRAWAGP